MPGSPRTLADIKAAAQTEKRPADEIRPYLVGLSTGEQVPLRDPDLITPAEQDDAPASFSGLKLQIYLMSPDGDSFRRVWDELRHFDGYEMELVRDDIDNFFRDQKTGKSRTPSGSSTATPTPSRPTSGSSSA